MTDDDMTLTIPPEPSKIAMLRSTLAIAPRGMVDGATVRELLEHIEELRSELRRRPAPGAAGRRVDRVASEWRAENQALRAELARVATPTPAARAEAERLGSVGGSCATRHGAHRAGRSGAMASIWNNARPLRLAAAMTTPIADSKARSTTPPPGTQCRTRTIVAADFTGASIKREHLEARTDGDGVFRGAVPGHGGDVWWVEHPDGSVGAYMFDEVLDREPTVAERARSMQADADAEIVRLDEARAERSITSARDAARRVELEAAEASLDETLAVVQAVRPMATRNDLAAHVHSLIGDAGGSQLEVDTLAGVEVELAEVTRLDDLRYLVRRFEHESGVRVGDPGDLVSLTRALAGTLRMIRDRDARRREEGLAAQRPVFSARAAMTRAGLDGSPGSGLSTADAIDELAKQRDRYKAEVERLTDRLADAEHRSER